MVAAAAAQEVWSTRSDHPLAQALGWAGPWTLAAAPAVGVAGALAGDEIAVAAAAAGSVLARRRSGGHPRPGKADLVLYAHNVLGANRHSGRLTRTLAEIDPDIAVLVEVGEAQERAIRRAWPDHHVEVARGRGYLGVAVATRHPVERVERKTAAYYPVLAVTTAGVTVLGIHFPSPRGGLPALVTNAEQMEAAREVGEIVRALTGPLVVAGDFNATRWNHTYRHVLEAGALVDAVRSCSRGWFLTYPAHTPVIRIDHVMVRGLDPRWARVLPPGGSDHRPVQVGLDRV